MNLKTKSSFILSKEFHFAHIYGPIFCIKEQHIAGVLQKCGRFFEIKCSAVMPTKPESSFILRNLFVEIFNLYLTWLFDGYSPPPLLYHHYQSDFECLQLFICS